VSQGRILVVDDEKDVATIVQIGLSKAGFAVKVEYDPIEAYKKFRPNDYDLVILDVRMPDISGIELYQRLYEIDNKLKVCFFSASAAPEVTAKYRELVNDACFVEKPVSITKLVQIVKSQIMLGR
jgi:DNA-binding response OmpR family regulator